MFLQERLIKGENEALEKIYKLYFSRVYGICMKYVQDEDLAADLVQEVFLKLWHNRAAVSKELPMEQQLFVLTKNKVFDHFRKKATEAKMLAQYQVHYDQTGEEEPLERDSRYKKIQALISQLPEKQRQVLELSRFRGYTYEEIAEEMGISVHTVSNHFSAAMKFLRTHLSFLLCCSGAHALLLQFLS